MHAPLATRPPLEDGPGRAGPDARGARHRRRAGSRDRRPVDPVRHHGRHRSRQRPAAADVGDRPAQPRRACCGPGDPRGRAECPAAVLTDYHLHLRPDDERHARGEVLHGRQRRAPPEVAETAGSPSSAWRSTSTASTRRSTYTPPVVVEVRRRRRPLLDFVREESDLRLGIEAGCVPGREDGIANLPAPDGTYIVGSVHFLRTGRRHGRHSTCGPRRYHQEGLEALLQDARRGRRTGLDDIIAHPDLVKMWGRDAPQPEGDLRLLRARHQAFPSAVAVEVSPPACADRRGDLPARPTSSRSSTPLPIALSSDAHLPEHVGHGYDERWSCSSRSGSAS